MKMRTGVLLMLMVVFTARLSVITAQDATAQPRQRVTIAFAARVGDEPVVCGETYQGVGSAGSSVTVNDFRMYISDVRLLTAQLDEVPLDLTQDGLWQVNNVALLDFEDGSASCSEAGNAPMNGIIVGTAPEGAYSGVAFTLGVPFEYNHQDTTVAPSPLNIPAMWWNWQGGYKFIRLDIGTPNGQAPSWLVHIGSTGCRSVDNNTPPLIPCSNPNRVTVHLTNFDPSENVVVADLATLLANVNVDEPAPQPEGCMAGPLDPDCIAVFPAFGLDLASGYMIEDQPQTFFRVG